MAHRVQDLKPVPTLKRAAPLGEAIPAPSDYPPYHVRIALMDDLSDGKAWLSSPDPPTSRIVQISRRHHRRKIYCEALQIDQHYIRLYNLRSPAGIPEDCIHTAARVITLEKQYRDRLGIEMKPNDPIAELNIKSSRAPLQRAVYGLLFCLQHPKIDVRAATWLAIIFGVLSLIMGIPALLPVVE